MVYICEGWMGKREMERDESEMKQELEEEKVVAILFFLFLWKVNKDLAIVIARAWHNDHVVSLVWCIDISKLYAIFYLTLFHFLSAASSLTYLLTKCRTNAIFCECKNPLKDLSIFAVYNGVAKCCKCWALSDATSPLRRQARKLQLVGSIPTKR